jgi:hypothetical protein
MSRSGARTSASRSADSTPARPQTKLAHAARVANQGLAAGQKASYATEIDVKRRYECVPVRPHRVRAHPLMITEAGRVERAVLQPALRRLRPRAVRAHARDGRRARRRLVDHREYARAVDADVDALVKLRLNIPELFLFLAQLNSKLNMPVTSETRVSWASSDALLSRRVPSSSA